MCFECQNIAGILYYLILSFLCVKLLFADFDIKENFDVKENIETITAEYQQLYYTFILGY